MRSPQRRGRPTSSSPAWRIASRPRTSARALDELVRVRALRRIDAPARGVPRIVPLTPVPLSTMVLNVTNQCNLSCTLLLRVRRRQDRPDRERHASRRWMSEETARESVDFLLRESGPSAHMTFFGGETLLNFRVLKTDGRLRDRAGRRAGQDDRLQPDDQRDAAQARGHRVPRRAPVRRDDFDRRARRTCRTSSACSTTAPAATTLMAPKIKALLARHRSRPIGARVTLTRDTLAGPAHLRAPDATRSGSGKSASRRSRRRPAAPHAFGDDGLRARARAVPRSGAGLSATRRSRTVITASATSARRSARSTRARARRGPAAPGSGCSASRPPATSISAIASPGRTITSSARCATASIATRSARFSSRTTSRNKTDCADVLGAAALRRRLLSRGAHAVRHHRAAQPALLRLDSRVDRHVPDRSTARSRRRNPAFLHQFEETTDEAPQPS